jgi:lincosamide nucleotidyltransferase A/C/D/E
MELSWLGPQPQTPVERFLCSAVDALQQGGIPFWLFGGYALDAYAGRPLRQHQDVDFLARAVDRSPLLAALASVGCTLHHQPMAFRVEHDGRAVADIVLVEEDAQPSPCFRSPEGIAFLPPGSLSEGMTARMWGREVPVVSLGCLYVLKARRRPGAAGPSDPRHQTDLTLIRFLLPQETVDVLDRWLLVYG